MPTLLFFGLHYLSSYQIIMPMRHGILNAIIICFSCLVFTLRYTRERKKQIEQNYNQPTKVFTRKHFRI